MPRPVIIVLVLALGGGFSGPARDGFPDVEPPTPRGGSGPPPSIADTTETGEPADPWAPLDPAERDTLLRMAWRTLVGKLEGRPIETRDLEEFHFTSRLLTPRGCFITLEKSGHTRGMQGDVEPTRPLYQQVIDFTRRAATRDPRFAPLAASEMDVTTLEISLIGRRTTVDDPEVMSFEGQGLYLEKWGRRALFLPRVISGQGWDARQALDELCRQASLSAGCWSEGARVELLETETIAGPRPTEILPVPQAPGPRPQITPPQREPTGPERTGRSSRTVRQ